MLKFCAARDVDRVHEAVDGWGTDESKLIGILCARSKGQLIAMNYAYNEKFGKPLTDVMKSELGGLFEGDLSTLVQYLLTDPVTLDVEFLHDAIAGFCTCIFSLPLCLPST